MTVHPNSLANLELGKFKPGQSGNPRGRPVAGLRLQEWFNELSRPGVTKADLMKIANDEDADWVQRAAAEQALRAMGGIDAADLEGWIDGEESLDAIRQRGVLTKGVKKMKIRTTTAPDGARTSEREVEFHNSTGESLDRISDQTVGKPTQRIESIGDAVPHVLQVYVSPLPSRNRPTLPMVDTTAEPAGGPVEAP